MPRCAPFTTARLTRTVVLLCLVAGQLLTPAWAAALGTAPQAPAAALSGPIYPSNQLPTQVNPAQAAIDLIVGSIPPYRPAALKELGGQDNVKALLAAMVTAGALNGLNTSLNLNGINSSSSFGQQLGKNLINGISSSLIGSAINGTSPEQALRNAIKGALINTAAAQGAFAIGSARYEGSIDAFTQKFLHALSGCLAGAATTGNQDGCAPGAVGAVVGELMAEWYKGNNPNATPAEVLPLVNMASQIGVALAGGTVQQMQIAGGAATNAAENNALAHVRNKASIAKFVAPKVKELDDKVAQGLITPEQRELALIDLEIKAKKLDAQVTVAKAAMQGASQAPLSSEQATKLAQTILELSPFGTPESIAQLLSGKESLTGAEANRLFAAIGCVPLLGGGIKLIAKGADGAIDLYKVAKVGDTVILNDYKIAAKWADKDGTLKWINPLTNAEEAFVAGTKVHVDHILPKKVFDEMPGFNALPPSIQSQLMNDIDNLQPMLASANCSKGCKVEFGNSGWATWNGEAVSREYRERLAEIQENIRRKVLAETQKWNIK